MSGYQEPTGRPWWQGLVIVALLLGIGYGLWRDELKPTAGERDRAERVVCADARRLLKAGLLDEARVAYQGISKHDIDCRTSDSAVVARGRRAAHYREQGDVYLRAAQLTRKDEQRAEARDAERAAARFEAAREVAIQRSINGYTRSLRNEPHDAATRESLRTALALMAVPPDPGANARCRVARKLRRAHLVGEAGIVYAQALRTGRTTRCVANKLRDARDDRAFATRHWRRGERAEQAGDKQEGRREYIEALRLDPSLASAKQALAASAAPDPGAAKVEVADATGWVERAAADAQDFAKWLTDHGGAAAVALVAAGLVLFVLMLVIFVVTKVRPVRSLVGWFHLPDFARRQYLVSPFSPADRGDTSTSVFLHWVMVPDPDPKEKGDEAVRGSPTPLEAWEGDERKQDADMLLEGQAGVLVTVWRWLQRARPREETHFAGHALELCQHGPGLRVLVKERRGGVVDAGFWWAADLPGEPLTGKDDEAEARHALAIYAAAWARQTAEMP